MPRLRLLLRGCSFVLFLRLFVVLLLPVLIRSIQPAQIRLPSNRNNTRKDAPMLNWHKRKVESVDDRPELTALPPRRRNCVENSFFGLLKAATSKQALQPKEVRVEGRHEERLMDTNLCSKAERVRAVVEVVAQESKPLVSWYRSDCANRHCP